MSFLLEFLTVTMTIIWCLLNFERESKPNKWR